jgi:hypothetical protein
MSACDLMELIIARDRTTEYSANYAARKRFTDQNNSPAWAVQPVTALAGFVCATDLSRKQAPESSQPSPEKAQPIPPEVRRTIFFGPRFSNKFPPQSGR